MQTQNRQDQVFLTPDVLQRLEYHHCLQLKAILNRYTDLGPNVSDRFQEYLSARASLYISLFNYIRGNLERTDIEPVLQLFKETNDLLFSSDLGNALNGYLAHEKIGIDPQYRSIWYKNIDELTDYAHELAAEARTFRSTEFDPTKESPERLARFMEYKREFIQLGGPINLINIDYSLLNSNNSQIAQNAVNHYYLQLLTVANRPLYM